MIKTTLQKTVFLIEDTKTRTKITVEASPDKVQLLNERGDKEFIFECNNTTEVRKRWRNVVRLMNTALTTIEQYNDTHWPLLKVKR